MAKRKPIMPDEWPELLKALRKRHALTQAEAAEKTGVALPTWVCWENRQRIPGRIAQRLLFETFPRDF